MNISMDLIYPDALKKKMRKYMVKENYAEMSINTYLKVLTKKKGRFNYIDFLEKVQFDDQDIVKNLRIVERMNDKINAAYSNQSTQNKEKIAIRFHLKYSMCEMRIIPESMAMLDKLVTNEVEYKEPITFTPDQKVAFKKVITSEDKYVNIRDEIMRACEIERGFRNSETCSIDEDDCNEPGIIMVRRKGDKGKKPETISMGLWEKISKYRNEELREMKDKHKIKSKALFVKHVQAGHKSKQKDKWRLCPGGLGLRYVVAKEKEPILAETNLYRARKTFCTNLKVNDQILDVPENETMRVADHYIETHFNNYNSAKGLLLDLRTADLDTELLPKLYSRIEYCNMKIQSSCDPLERHCYEVAKNQYDYYIAKVMMTKIDIGTNPHFKKIFRADAEFDIAQFEKSRNNGSQSVLINQVKSHSFLGLPANQDLLGTGKQLNDQLVIPVPESEAQVSISKVELAGQRSYPVIEKFLRFLKAA